MNSRPVSITQVYPQDTEPTDTRDGILWVDTSASPPATYTFDRQSSEWAPVASSDLSVQDTAPDSPTDGEVWVDTSLSRPRAKVYDAGAGQWNKQVDATEFGSHKSDSSAHGLGTHKSDASAHHTRPTATQTAKQGGGYGTQTDDNNTYFDIQGIVDEVTINVPSSYDVNYWIRTDRENGTIDSGTCPSGSSVTHTYSSQYVHTVYCEGISGYSYDCEVHYLNVPEHSHQI